MLIHTRLQGRLGETHVQTAGVLKLRVRAERVRVCLDHVWFDCGELDKLHETAARSDA